jgi:hypothetical protein
MAKDHFDWNTTMPKIEKAGDKFVSSSTVNTEGKKKWYFIPVAILYIGSSWIGFSLLAYYMWKSIFEYLEW